jgi:hypothetical protein
MRARMHCLVLLFLCVALPTEALAQLYRVRSTEMGIQAFDITVTEVKREERTSLLSIPGYHKRSAAASRWMMCAYTDLALHRGFKFWAVVAPKPPDENVLLGFPQAEGENIAQTLGPRFAGDSALISSTETFAAFCGIAQQPTK